MLAPRNKLWSTPVEVIEEAIKLLEITPEDTVYDIGCGKAIIFIQRHSCIIQISNFRRRTFLISLC